MQVLAAKSSVPEAAREGALECLAALSRGHGRSLASGLQETLNVAVKHAQRRAPLPLVSTERTRPSAALQGGPWRRVDASLRSVRDLPLCCARLIEGLIEAASDGVAK